LGFSKVAERFADRIGAVLSLSPVPA